MARTEKKGLSLHWRELSWRRDELVPGVGAQNSFLPRGQMELFDEVTLFQAPQAFDQLYYFFFFLPTHAVDVCTFSLRATMGRQNLSIPPGSTLHSFPNDLFFLFSNTQESEGKKWKNKKLRSFLRFTKSSFLFLNKFVRNLFNYLQKYSRLKTNNEIPWSCKKKSIKSSVCKREEKAGENIQLLIDRTDKNLIIINGCTSKYLRI